MSLLDPNTTSLEALLDYNRLLASMAAQERTVQGWLDVSSQVGKGTSIIVSVPLP